MFERAITDTEALVMTLMRAHIQHINTHRQMETATVMTAVAVFIAAQADLMSCGDDGPTVDEVLEMLFDAAKDALAERGTVRGITAQVIEEVVHNVRQ